MWRVEVDRRGGYLNQFDENGNGQEKNGGSDNSDTPWR
jgi:hypothetical protein